MMDIVVILCYLSLIWNEWNSIKFKDHSPMLVSFGIAAYTANIAVFMTLTLIVLHFKFGLTLVEATFAIP